MNISCSYCAPLAKERRRPRPVQQCGVSTHSGRRAAPLFLAAPVGRSPVQHTNYTRTRTV